MSCSCCCCVTPSGELLDGIRKKERLVSPEEEEESRRNMDISLLREQYRSTRETQKRHTHVLLFRTVSEELAEAVSIIPVTQGLTSPWEPNSSSPPAVTFDPDPTTCDPWHAHLGLHRRCRPGVTVQVAASSPETMNTNSSSRGSSSSSESVFRSLSVDSGSSCSTREEEVKTDPVQQVCVSGPLDGSSGDARERSAAASDDSSTPVASISCSPSSSSTSLHQDPDRPRTAGDGVLHTAYRRVSAPALRFTRQLSVGGVGCSMGVHQNQNQNQIQNYHPFPNRKTPRISEAARRLGMYSSF